MKLYLVSFALVLSLLFNVFFAVGYLQVRARAEQAEAVNGASAPTSETNVVDESEVARRLQLDPSQAEFFRDLRRGMREDDEAFRRSLRLAQQDLADELAKDEPDLVRVQEINDRVADMQREHRMVASQRFGEFLSVLDPEQCRRMAHHLRRGRHGGPGGHGGRRGGPPLEHFDRDGDGTLSDEERQAARAHWERRREERDKRRREMRERFDLNDDGVLDPAERNAMKEWMLRKRGERERERGERD